MQSHIERTVHGPQRCIARSQITHSERTMKTGAMAQILYIDTSPSQSSSSNVCDGVTRRTAENDLPYKVQELEDFEGMEGLERWSAGWSPIQSPDPHSPLAGATPQR